MIIKTSSSFPCAQKSRNTILESIVLIVVIDSYYMLRTWGMNIKYFNFHRLSVSVN